MFIYRISRTEYAIQQACNLHKQTFVDERVEYLKEQWRGYDFKEDLFVPGYFQLEMSVGESIVFTSGLTETKVDGLLHTFSLEVDKSQTIVIKKFIAQCGLEMLFEEKCQRNISKSWISLVWM